MLRRMSPAFATTAAVALLATAGFALAQAGKDAPKAADAGDSSGSFEVSGVEIDVRAKDAESARLGGWRSG